MRFGLSHHLTTRYTGPLLRAARQFDAAGHLLRLHLREGYTADLIRWLLEGELEAAYILGECDRTPEELHALPVTQEKIMLLVKSDDPLGSEEILPLSVLRGEALILPSSASSVYRLSMAAVEAARVRPGRIVEVSGPAAVRSAIIHGLGSCRSAAPGRGRPGCRGAGRQPPQCPVTGSR